MNRSMNFVAGEWIAGAGWKSDINPGDLADELGSYASADGRQVQDAVDAARRAFGPWSACTPQQRFDALDRIGGELLARKEELGILLTREQGKTKAEAVAEVARAGSIFKFFAGEAVRLHGEKGESVRAGVEVDVTREPVGVVGLITPWNFPMAIPAWKIAPALAHGNCVVFKPADLVPGCAWALAEIISRSGLPAGVFNLVMGSGSVVGQAIARSPGVDAVSFTGSQKVGEGLRRDVVGRGARLQLEMGGKNPLVVLDDAHVPTAVECAVNGAFFSTGQRCTASSRFIVAEGIHDRFVAAVIERMKGLTVGYGLEDGVDIGPVASESQLAQNLSYVDIGQQEGARLAWGGDRLSRERQGYYMAPALLTETSPDMRVNREEIFGPVASVIRVADFEQALAVANDTPFGLSAGIVTASLKHANAFKRHAKAGMVMVNLPTAGVDYHVPFGGRKASSFGPREQGSHARDFYTVTKTAYTFCP